MLIQEPRFTFEWNSIKDNDSEENLAKKNISIISNQDMITPGKSKRESSGCIKRVIRISTWLCLYGTGEFFMKSLYRALEWFME